MKQSSEILLVVALLAASFVLPSLEAGDAAEPAERRAAFAAELGLSADQQSALQTLREQERAAYQALKADPALSPEQKRDQARVLRQQFSTQRSALLTDAQKAQLKEKRAERGHRDGKPGRKGGKRGSD